MKHRSLTALAVFAIVLLSTIGSAQAPSAFTPLAHWKAVIISGNAKSLNHLYSSDPPARVSVVTKSSAEISAEADAEFWTKLRARQLSLNISESISPQPGVQQVTFQATIRTAPPGRTLYVVDTQLWQQQAGVWKLVAVERTDAR